MSDKRSVHTDALATLGTIIDDTAGRDAIHLAVEPVIASQKLHPGQDIKVKDGKAYAATEDAVGIVDPFLKYNVQEGECFWLIVYPRTITSLRHVWEHPAFDSPKATKDSKSKSEEWLREFCRNADCPSYEVVVASVIEGDYDGEYLHFKGRDAHGVIPSEFWDHMENIIGRKITNRAEYFSCSC